MAAEQGNQDKKSSSPWRRRIRIMLLILGPLALCLGGVWYWLSHRGYVSTDDAYVEADQVTISPQVSGRVISVPVNENEAVRRGQILLRLDPKPYEVALAAADAKLASVKEEIQAWRAQYHALQAKLAGAKSNVAYFRTEVERKTHLARHHVVPTARLNKEQNELTQAQQQVAAINAQEQEILAHLGGKLSAPLKSIAAYNQAEAAVHKAELNLSYTVVRAPAKGVVAKVDVKGGDMLAAGAPAFPLLETAKYWVKANFKETELTHVHPGEPATITIDTYPGHVWHGYVESLSPGSGQVFSLLPAQNATGNWVKVVQRIPVRVAFKKHPSKPVLRAGMSSEVTIKVSGSSSASGNQPH